MILSVENNLDRLPQTLNSFTSTNIVTGAGTIPVKNINSFKANYAIQIGKTGEEQAEVVLLDSSAPSGTSIILSGTTRFNHNIDTPLYNIHYDKIVFKRSTTGTAGNATAIATVSITPDSLYTEYNDTSGAATYAYKTQYYNSNNGDVSSESDWFVPGGPTFYSLQKLRKRIKDNLYNAGYLKDDSIIDDWINEWIEDMTNAAIKVNKDYALGTALVAFGTTGLGTITDSDFKQPIKVEITYDGLNYTNSAHKPVNQINDYSDTYNGIDPVHYWLGDTLLGVKPPGGNGGTARITFGKRNPILENDTDELPLTLRAYTIGCIEWCLWRAYDFDQKDSQANSHFSKFKDKKADFISEITPRDQTGPQTIYFADALSGRDDDIDLDYFY